MKFIYNGIDLELDDKLYYMFGGVVVVGENPWAPSMDPSHNRSDPS